MYQTGKNSWLKHWDFILLDLLCMQIAYIAAFMLRQRIDPSLQLGRISEYGYYYGVSRAVRRFFPGKL